MNHYSVCPKCGFFREFSDEDNHKQKYREVEHHCRECNEVMINECPSKICTLFLDDLSAKYCECGQELPFLVKANERKLNQSRIKPRQSPGFDQYRRS